MLGTPSAAPGMVAVMSMSGAFTNAAEIPGALGGITPTGRTNEGYFEQQPIEYFPPMPPQTLPEPASGQSSGSSLGTDQSGSKDGSRRPSSVSSAVESELDLNFARTGSSVATTVDEEEEDRAKADHRHSVLVEEMEKISLEQIGLETKKGDPESLTRSKSVDDAMMQLNESALEFSSEENSPAPIATSLNPDQGAESSRPSTSTAALLSGKRPKPHPTFQASEFASIVSGFQGIVPPHMQSGEERVGEDGVALTPGHGRRASWTPGTEYASYM